MKNLAALICLGLLGSMPAVAGHTEMKGMDHGTMEAAASSGKSEASKAFEAANQKMHAAMSTAYTGDPDVDFAKGMIAHHQGAIAMAEVELKYRKDPEMRKLEEDIIKPQGPEIASMNAWLAKHTK